MRLHAFGPDPGIGGALRTLAMLVDGDVLVEAGSGLGELSFDALTQIDHVLISYGHMDHIACLPMLVDAVAKHRSFKRRPLFPWNRWADQLMPTARQEGPNVFIGGVSGTWSFEHPGYCLRVQPQGHSFASCLEMARRRPVSFPV